jgi:hypothetical protein
MGIINRSRRGKMKLLINYYVYIIITFLLYDTIDRSEYESEKERWIRELWIDITIRSRCGKMKVLNTYNIYIYNFIILQGKDQGRSYCMYSIKQRIREQWRMIINNTSRCSKMKV